MTIEGTATPCPPAMVGHAYASTTGLYTSVSADFKQRSVRQMIARRLGQLEGPAHD